MKVRTAQDVKQFLAQGYTPRDIQRKSRFGLDALEFARTRLDRTTFAKLEDQIIEKRHKFNSMLEGVAQFFYVEQALLCEVNARSQIVQARRLAAKDGSYVNRAGLQEAEARLGEMTCALHEVWNNQRILEQRFDALLHGG